VGRSAGKAARTIESKTRARVFSGVIYLGRPARPSPRIHARLRGFSRLRTTLSHILDKADREFSDLGLGKPPIDPKTVQMTME